MNSERTEHQTKVCQKSFRLDITRKKIKNKQQQKEKQQTSKLQTFCHVRGECVYSPCDSTEKKLFVVIM